MLDAASELRREVWRRPTIRASPGAKGPPAHPPELTYPCCLPALGEFSEMTPYEGSPPSLAQRRTALKLRTPTPSAPLGRPSFSIRPLVGYPRTCCHQEDSPSGLWRRLGKAVGLTPSGVRIPHPPPNSWGSVSTGPHVVFGFQSSCPGASPVSTAPTRIDEGYGYS